MSHNLGFITFKSILLLMSSLHISFNVILLLFFDKVNFGPSIFNSNSGFLISILGPFIFKSGSLFLSISISGFLIFISMEGIFIFIFPELFISFILSSLSIPHNLGFITFNLILSLISLEHSSFKVILFNLLVSKFKFGPLIFMSNSGFFLIIILGALISGIFILVFILGLSMFKLGILSLIFSLISFISSLLSIPHNLGFITFKFILSLISLLNVSFNVIFIFSFFGIFKLISKSPFNSGFLIFIFILGLSKFISGIFILIFISLFILSLLILSIVHNLGFITFKYISSLIASLQSCFKVLLFLLLSLSKLNLIPLIFALFISKFILGLIMLLLTFNFFKSTSGLIFPFIE